MRSSTKPKVKKPRQERPILPPNFEFRFEETDDFNAVKRARHLLLALYGDVILEEYYE